MLQTPPPPPPPLTITPATGKHLQAPRTSSEPSCGRLRCSPLGSATASWAGEASRPPPLPSPLPLPRWRRAACSRLRRSLLPRDRCCCGAGCSATSPLRVRVCGLVGWLGCRAKLAASLRSLPDAAGAAASSAAGTAPAPAPGPVGGPSAAPLACCGTVRAAPPVAAATAASYLVMPRPRLPGCCWRSTAAPAGAGAVAAAVAAAAPAPPACPAGGGAAASTGCAGAAAAAGATGGDAAGLAAGDPPGALVGLAAAPSGAAPAPAPAGAAAAASAGAGVGAWGPALLPLAAAAGAGAGACPSAAPAAGPVAFFFLAASKAMTCAFMASIRCSRSSTGLLVLLLAAATAAALGPPAAPAAARLPPARAGLGATGLTNPWLAPSLAASGAAG
jgi:hypothetical protein